MSEIITRTKKWGASLGIIIPSEVVKEEKIREGDEVIIEVRKKKTAQQLFGSLKGARIDSQKMKDELRKEWSKW